MHSETWVISKGFSIGLIFMFSLVVNFSHIFKKTWTKQRLPHILYIYMVSLLCVLICRISFGNSLRDFPQSLHSQGFSHSTVSCHMFCDTWGTNKFPYLLYMHIELFFQRDNVPVNFSSAMCSKGENQPKVSLQCLHWQCSSPRRIVPGVMRGTLVGLSTFLIQIGVVSR